MTKLFLLLACLFIGVCLYSQENIKPMTDWGISIKKLSLFRPNPYIEIEYKNISSTDKHLLLPIKKPGFPIKLEGLEDKFSILLIQVIKNQTIISRSSLPLRHKQNRLGWRKKQNSNQNQTINRSWKERQRFLDKIRSIRRFAFTRLHRRNGAKIRSRL